MVAVGAGDRDREIQIIPQVATKSKAGAAVSSPGLPINEWACKVVAKQSTKYINAEQTLFSEVSFEIAYREDINTTAHVTCEGVVYDVVHIAEIGYREGLRLYCRSQGQGGKR